MTIWDGVFFTFEIVLINTLFFYLIYSRLVRLERLIDDKVIKTEEK